MKDIMEIRKECDCECHVSPSSSEDMQINGCELCHSGSEYYPRHPPKEDLSQCPFCLCMTHTIKGKCGKCGKHKDIYFNPEDESTTLLFRATSCCKGHHQSIAGALLRSPEWKSWYDYAKKHMLFDVDETQ